MHSEVWPGGLEGLSQVPQTGGPWIEAIVATGLVVEVDVRGFPKTLQPPDGMFHPKQEDLGRQGQAFSASVPRHGVVLVKITPSR